jgi:nitrilase
MRERLRILACQIDVPEIVCAADRDRHLERSAQEVSRRLDREAVDLVVLPELSSVPYSRPAFDRLEIFAEDFSGPSFQTWSRVARQFGVTVVFGIPRLGNAGYHISQVAVGPDGALLGHFDKLHIAQYGASMEKEYFARGNHLFVFECKGVRIATIICYDIRVPELTRTLTLRHGVQLILHCGAYYRDETFFSWHDFVVSRAMENQIHFLSLNRAGKLFGNSMFCPPWVDDRAPPVRFPSFEEAFLVLEVDPDEAGEVRERYSFLADRLDDYGALELNRSSESAGVTGLVDMNKVGR